MGKWCDDGAGDGDMYALNEWVLGKIMKSIYIETVMDTQNKHIHI